MDAPISPSDFRLFFNRFVRKAHDGYEVKVPNIPEFVQECERIAKLLVQRLSEPKLTALMRVRLLNDLGVLSLVASSVADEGSYSHARALQKIYLGNRLFGPDAWSLAEQTHLLVHHCATFWRATLWDVPTPVELGTQGDIVRYLFSIASKTPSVVDAQRYSAVEHFVHHPTIVNDSTTTRTLVELFDKNWFHPNTTLNVLRLEDAPHIRVVYTGPITAR